MNTLKESSVKFLHFLLDFTISIVVSVLISLVFFCLASLGRTDPIELFWFVVYIPSFLILMTASYFSIIERREMKKQLKQKEQKEKEKEEVLRLLREGKIQWELEVGEDRWEESGPTFKATQLSGFSFFKLQLFE